MNLPASRLSMPFIWPLASCSPRVAASLRPTKNGPARLLALLIAGILLAALPLARGQTLTTLYNFSGGDGYMPYAGLKQGTDGNFYGTTLVGGISNNGTVYRITRRAL